MKKYIKLLLSCKWQIIIAALAVIIVIAGYNLLDQSEIDVTFYQVNTDKISDNIRIVVLADMHLKELGENNIELVDKIRSLYPDIIACVGDMNLTDEPDCSPVTRLCEQLVNIAPVYYSLGNNEYAAQLFNNSTLSADLENIGVHVLDDESETVTVKNSTINIGGMSQGPDQFERYGHQFFDAYAQEDHFKLLLAHYPELFQGYIENYGIDLALCGHAHGGQVRLPFIGGLYSTGQGWFPELTEGLHEIGSSKVVISRGLGNSSIVPRFNNPPELCVVDLCWY